VRVVEGALRGLSGSDKVEGSDAAAKTGLIALRSMKAHGGPTHLRPSFRPQMPT
jgi:hypothetical protein